MKKIVSAILLVSILCLGLASCGSSAKYNVGICQLVQHPALDAATEGFMKALTDKLGDSVAFDLQNASNDSSTCSVIVNQFVSSGKIDLIMANATPALQAAIAATGTIPIVATSITDYATALETSEWTGKSGTNVTGTSDLAPLAEQAKMVAELCPDAKTVGILYCSAEANSKYQANVISKEFKNLGLEVKTYTSADSNDLAAVVTAAISEVDVIYVPTDNTIASNASIIDNIALPAGIPVIAGEEGICRGCGIATLSIDYYSIGYNAGLMAYDILVNKANPGEIEIGFASDLTKKYSPARCEELEITVPENYVALDEAA